MSDVIATIFLCAGFTMCAVAISLGICNDSWQADAVKRGYAQYNPKTGKWEWLELTKIDFLMR